MFPSLVNPLNNISNLRKEGQTWWLTPVIPATREAKMGGSHFKRISV
jgi:hypothetical protein